MNLGKGRKTTNLEIPEMGREVVRPLTQLERHNFMHC